MKRRSSPFDPQGSANIGRRSTPRLRLNVPAKLISVCDTQDCLLLDVSLTGAFLRLSRPLAVNDCGYLRVGEIEAFAISVRASTHNGSGAFCAVKFDVPLNGEQMIELRADAFNADVSERRALRMAARDWVAGIGRG